MRLPQSVSWKQQLYSFQFLTSWAIEQLLLLKQLQSLFSRTFRSKLMTSPWLNHNKWEMFWSYPFTIHLIRKKHQCILRWTLDTVVAAISADRILYISKTTPPCFAKLRPVKFISTHSGLGQQNVKLGFKIIFRKGVKKRGNLQSGWPNGGGGYLPRFLCPPLVSSDSNRFDPIRSDPRPYPHVQHRKRTNCQKLIS